MICGFGVDGPADHLGRFVDLVHRHVGSARDVEDDAVRALDGRLEQRRRDRLLRGIGGSMLAAALADAHHRRPGVGHDRLDVGEIEIDQSGLRDQIADSGDTLAEDVVGIRERFVKRRLLLDDLQDTLVRDRDQRVDLALELGDAVLGNLHPLFPFECEGLRYDRDRQRSGLSNDLGDHGERAGAGSAAMPAVRKTRSAPLGYREVPRDVSAASRPSVGFAPAPRPRVWFPPM